MTSRTTALGQAIRYALATTATLAALPAFAQDGSNATPTNLDRIEITGSRIRQVDVETAQPVFAISRNDIEKQRIVRASNHEVVIALTIAGLVNLAMVLMASAAFHAGHSDIAEIETAYHSLTPLLGTAAAGISPALSQRLAGIIGQLRAGGVGVLLVEHDVAFLASLSDRVYVMANGKIIASGTVAEVSADPAVVDAYLGDQVALATAHHLESAS